VTEESEATQRALKELMGRLDLLVEAKVRARALLCPPPRLSLTHPAHHT